MIINTHPSQEEDDQEIENSMGVVTSMTGDIDTVCHEMINSFDSQNIRKKASLQRSVNTSTTVLNQNQAQSKRSQELNHY